MRLGQINEEELRLANFRIAEARKMNPPENMNLHEVAVAIYVDGRLQYHGGETVGCDKLHPITRETMLVSVANTLRSVNPNGCVAFEETDKIPQ